MFQDFTALVNGTAALPGCLFQRVQRSLGVLYGLIRTVRSDPKFFQSILVFPDIFRYAADLFKQTVLGTGKFLRQGACLYFWGANMGFVFITTKL